MQQQTHNQKNVTKIKLKKQTKKTQKDNNKNNNNKNRKKRKRKENRNSAKQDILIIPTVIISNKHIELVNFTSCMV